MAQVIGIDTGGTYTDAVLLDTDTNGMKKIVGKAKAFTTHERLEEGIAQSLEKLLETVYGPEGKAGFGKIDKVVLSTTLATNAIVENRLHETGLIIVGDEPGGKIAARYIERVPGKINIKGRVLVNVNRKAVEEALKRMLPNVEAIAISGAASVRNPAQEHEVRDIIRENCDLPVLCGSEFVHELGYLERTNTVIINAGLLPIINRFLEAIDYVLSDMNIDAPVFVVKGDGSMASKEFIKKRPIDTALSGPAASMIGTINLTGIENAIVADMGGTTTDTGVVKGKRVELSDEGAEVGGWRIKIKSAKLYTFGLGGDSLVSFENGKIKIGPRRTLPACRGGKDGITPTDIVHYTGEFIKWDRALALKAVKKSAEKFCMKEDAFVKAVEDAISEKIFTQNIEHYRLTGYPVCAIGAPAETWYNKARKKYNFDLIVPENYDVASAVGAAVAGIQKTAEAIVRPGEEGRGFLVHSDFGRYFFRKKHEAVEKACLLSKEYAESYIRDQNMEPDQIEIECLDIYTDGDRLIYISTGLMPAGDEMPEGEDHLGKFVETRVKVSANGKNFI